MEKTILVSACLLGLNTRYNAERRRYPVVERFLSENQLVPIPACPEQLAGFATPRPSASFIQGDGDALLEGDGMIHDQLGNDLSAAFVAGANETLRLARLANCRKALLKERSPSCGCSKVYLQNTLIEGRGVTAALLKRNHITVISEEEL